MEWCRYCVFILLIAFCVPKASYAEEAEEHNDFNTVEYIFEHVNDSHEIFFFSTSTVKVAIPLPVILYSPNSGWHFFSSRKLYSNNESFPFFIAKEGENKDKIIEKLSEGSEIVPFDLSITKTVAGMIVVALLLVIVLVKASSRARKNPLAVPHGLQNLVEPVVNFIREDIAIPFIGARHVRYLPFLLTMFFFILVSNLIGLVIPLGINITGNIAVTFVLAFFTFVITSVSGNRQYWSHIFNPPDVPWFMKLPIPLIPFVEFMGIFTKPIILMVRLFANMFSGHMIVAVLIALIFLMSSVFNLVVGVGTSLISVLFSVFIITVDILVSFIQAYIFTVLSAMYFGTATSEVKH